MYGRIRFYDYRCFQREAPATLEIRPGLTSFIGPNNAGKSALIKAIYEIRPILQVISDWHRGATNPSATIVWAPQKPMHDHAEIVSERAMPQCKIEIEIDTTTVDQIKGLTLLFSESGAQCSTKLSSPEGDEISGIYYYGLERPSSVRTKNNAIYSLELISDFARSLINSIYLGPFRNAINEGAAEYFDCSVGTQFIEQWKSWKTGGIKEKTRALQKATDDIRELIEAKNLEINASSELKTLQLVIDGRAHMLPEIGAGISQMVVVLANALIKKPPFIFIDEPELNLHPSLQFSFLTKLAKYSSHGLVYTTHAIGLARLADRCYTVQRKNNRSIVRPYEENRNLTEFLGSLGIAGLLELGWDRILLVEGPTDVRVAQQILKIYGKNHHTVVLPLGGDSMANGKFQDEFHEFRRLCPEGSMSMAAIVDSEQDSADGKPIKSRQGFAKICEDLKIKCLLTKRRATENYINQSAIDATWPSHHYRELEPFEKLRKDGSSWGKEDTWRAVCNMTREDFDKTDIGPFFESI